MTVLKIFTVLSEKENELLQNELVNTSQKLDFADNTCCTVFLYDHIITCTCMCTSALFSPSKLHMPNNTSHYTVVIVKSYGMIYKHLHMLISGSPLPLEDSFSEFLCSKAVRDVSLVSDFSASTVSMIHSQTCTYNYKFILEHV